jgi:hypothetical protein
MHIHVSMHPNAERERSKKERERWAQAGKWRSKHKLFNESRAVELKDQVTLKRGKGRASR